jgi:hypothetical protein
MLCINNFINKSNILFKERKNMAKYEMCWKCPVCGTTVDFKKQMQKLFEIGKRAPRFNTKEGTTNSIECSCGAVWMISISQMYKLLKKEVKHG